MKSAPIPAAVLEHDCGCGSAWLRARAGETAIDLGCGSGKTCLLLARAVGPRGRMIGVDASAAMIAVARAIVLPNLELVERRIQDLGGVLADERADLVVLDCVWTFVPERERGAILAQAARLLRPGGRLELSDFLAEDLERVPDALAAAGFAGVEVLERSDAAHRTIDGIPRSATTIGAIRPR